MSFKIELDKFFQIPTLKIELIGHYSIDGDSEYRADLSQLKYYIPPSDLNNVNYDLNENIASTRYKPTSYIKLDDILKWILDNFKQLEKPLSTQRERWLNVDFICRRGALSKIMTSSCEKSWDWIICASKYRGTIYLCEFYTDTKELDHVNAIMADRQSWGFKFEQCMVADHPSHQPNTSVPVNACEAFHCVFRSTFGDHSLLYEAEIDGISSKDYITDTLVGKQFEIIELKTLRLPELGELYAKFSPKKALPMWSQNYLADVKQTIFGLRHGTGEVVKIIKEYSTDDLLNLSYADCNVNKCKMFLKLFLDNVKRIVTKDHNECMYKFYWNGRNGNIINYNEEKPDNEKYIFVKPQFVHKADKQQMS